MKLGCLLLGAALLSFAGLSCSGSEEVDPLSSAGGFCEEWAKRACGEAVVTKCEADDVEECRSGQARFCEGLVPGSLYSKEGAKDCLEFVELAYKDGALTAEERDAVRSLGAPCDLVLSGDGRTDEDCRENSDCDRVGGFDCVIPLGQQEGTCQKPNKVSGGSRCGNADDVCGAGYYCSEGGYCLEGGGAGDSCSELVLCARGLNCEINADTQEGACVARLPKGEEGCEVDSDCQTGICRTNGDRSICSSTISLDPLEPICDDLR